MTGPGRRPFEAVDASPDAAAMVAGMDELSAHPAVRALRAWSAETLALTPGGSVLDAGCGPGGALLELAAMVAPGGRAIGVDTSTLMLDTARARAAASGVDVDLREGSILALPIGDGEVHAARAERVLQHLDDPAAAVAELVRVVRPGGVVSLIDTDWSTARISHRDDVVQSVLGVAQREAIPSPEVGRFLRSLLLDAGLDEVAIDARVLVVLEPPEMARRMLPRHLDRAVELGLLTADRAETFRSDLDHLVDTGRYLQAVTMYAATGRRPRT